MNAIGPTLRVRASARPDRLPPPGKRSPAAARTAVVAFLLVAVVGTAGFTLYLDFGPPRLRDPEYGKRLSRLKARAADHPGRPVVLAVGSSRTAMGVRPGAVDPDPGGPLLFNFALAGSGPVMELMAVRRAVADGVMPAAVLLEYWPAFLREDAGYHEDCRVDPARLRPVDRPIVREYFRDPTATERRMLHHRLNPWFGHRKSLLNQASPGWLPLAARNEATWDKIDPWGWLPGREGATPEQRRAGLAAAAGYYAPLFAGYEVSPVADRALRQVVAECRERDVPVALVYLPEATGFRALMPPAAVKLADEHLAAVRRELDLPLLDFRSAMPDDDMPDGFHLTQAGAAAFTRMLAPRVAEVFPGVRRD